MRAANMVCIGALATFLGACAATQPAVTSATAAATPSRVNIAAQCPSERPLHKLPLVRRDAQLGPDDAPVTLVVFSDFQCPFCARVNGTIHQLRKQYGDALRVVFKHNALDFHRRARPAAYAALAAQEQGKFWPMHDLLFQRQQAWVQTKGNGPFLALAEEIGLNGEQFQRSLDDAERRFRSWIDADQQAAQDVDALGTPSFFINGEKLVGAQPLENFQEVIDRQRARAQCLGSQGVAAADLYDVLMDSIAIPSPFDETVHSFRQEGRPSLGPDNAPITIVEFTDFQCPYCSRMSALLQTVQSRMPKQVRLVVKHFPLSFHKQAIPAARATIAAHRQGQFWAMHDALFAHQSSLSHETIVTIATSLNLKMEQFVTDMADPSLNTHLVEDMNDAKAAGLRGTPTLYFNGRHYERSGASPEMIQRDIERFLMDKQP